MNGDAFSSHNFLTIRLLPVNLVYLCYIDKVQSQPRLKKYIVDYCRLCKQAWNIICIRLTTIYFQHRFLEENIGCGFTNKILFNTRIYHLYSYSYLIVTMYNHKKTYSIVCIELLQRLIWLNRHSSDSN